MLEQPFCWMTWATACEKAEDCVPVPKLYAKANAAALAESPPLELAWAKADAAAWTPTDPLAADPAKTSTSHSFPVLWHRNKNIALKASCASHCLALIGKVKDSRVNGSAFIEDLDSISFYKSQISNLVAGRKSEFQLLAQVETGERDRRKEKITSKSWSSCCRKNLGLPWTEGCGASSCKQVLVQKRQDL